MNSLKRANKLLIFIIMTVVSCMFFSFETTYSPEVTELSAANIGKKLFNDNILSKDNSISCSSCHKPEFGFADTSAFSIGIFNKPTKRNTPSVLNMKNRPYYFWDGRASSLNEQALMPIENPDEMGLPIEEAIKRLNASSYYKNYFVQVFGENPNKVNLAECFAAFEKTLETVDSKFDDWSNNLTKLSPSEERGRKIFLSKKAKCFDCHFLEDFTNDDFKNIGLFNGKELNDSGRSNISKNQLDIGKFKTPGLRNIAATAPYMHNGMFNTLEEVVEYYNDTKKVVPNPINIDPSLAKPLGLSEKEKKDLVSFLNTLTDKKFSKRTSTP